MTSSIPAEVMAGGISINMVTKDAGNLWRATCVLLRERQPAGENHLDPGAAPSFRTRRRRRASTSGGGALMRDKI